VLTEWFRVGKFLSAYENRFYHSKNYPIKSILLAKRFFCQYSYEWRKFTQ